MGLASVTQTALSGLNAATASINAISNNLANVNTNGFKESKPVFSTQTPNTRGLGAAPSGGSGGSNPSQTGTGVQTAAIVTNFSQGSLSITSNRTDLALQGNGFFIVAGENGEQLYSRNGNFKLNAAKQLVTVDGFAVQGFSVDANFQIQDTELSSITIPLGQTFNDGNGGAAALIDFTVGANGVVSGKFSDGTTRDLAQIQIARFANPGGLEQRGSNLYAEGVNSGLPIQSDPGQAGAAQVVSGAVELSNVDIGRNLIDLVLSETQFKTSLAVLDTADEMFESLLNLRR